MHIHKPREFIIACVTLHNFEHSWNIRLEILGDLEWKVLHKPYQNPNILHFASISIGYLSTSPSTIHVGIVTLTPKISFKNRSCSFEITSIFLHAHISQPYKRIGCTHFSKSSADRQFIRRDYVVAHRFYWKRLELPALEEESATSKDKIWLKDVLICLIGA